MTAFISVVVPFYDTVRYIGTCLSALESQNYPRDRYEIIAVNNNSRDGSLELAKRFEETRILTQTKQGSYVARNLGIEAAQGEIVAFTDSDCQPTSNWLRTIEESFTDPSIDILLGRNQPANGLISLSLLSDYEHAKNSYVFTSNIKGIYFGYTNNMAIRATVFSRVGVFEERFRGADSIFVNSYVNVYGCEGVRYEPRMRVRHLELDTLVSPLRKYFIYGRSRRAHAERFQIRALRNRERVKIFGEIVHNRKLPAGRTLLLFTLLLAGWFSWNTGDAVSRVGISRD